MTPYEPNDKEIELFILSLPLDQRPTVEEARVFLRLYGNGGLDGLTPKEMTERGMVMADSVSEAHARMLKGSRLAQALENPFVRRTAPVWEPIYRRGKRGQIDRRRAKKKNR